MSGSSSPAAFALTALVGIAAVAALPAHADDSRDAHLVIAETDETFRLSVPVSRLVLTFPRGGFGADLIDEETDGPRYFSFNDRSRGAMMTGWFEPANSYRGIEALWKAEVAAWKKAGLPAPVNVEFTRAGQWEAVVYDLEMPQGSNTHIRAQWVEAGTWIDLHISVTTSAPVEGARKTAREILDSVHITATEE